MGVISPTKPASAGRPAACADSTGLKVYGAGQWLEEKHGARSRRDWRKLHLAVDAKSGAIIAHKLTGQDTDDASQVEPLLSQIDGEIDQLTADGAYDGIAILGNKSLYLTSFTQAKLDRKRSARCMLASSRTRGEEWICCSFNRGNPQFNVQGARSI